MKELKKIRNGYMKDIVPYTPHESDLIRKTVGVDFSDSIAPYHPEGSKFVVERAFKCRCNGKYTGWWEKGKPSGRGTWRSNCGTIRIDSSWLAEWVWCGKMRFMDLNSGTILEGRWSFAEILQDDDVKCYTLATGSKVFKSFKKGEYCDSYF